MEYLTDDLLMSIFLRLPGRSLIRFKCLSKLWSLVFSDPKFTRNHLKTMSSLQNHKDFLLQYDNLFHAWSRLRIDTCFDCHEEGLRAEDMKCPVETSDRIRGTAHCDGILCMFTSNFCQDKRYSAVVWNPMTKEHKRFWLTRPSLWDAFGFGYDSVAEDYKIIHIQGSAPYVMGLRQQKSIHSLRLKAGIQNAPLNNVPYSFTISTCNQMATTVNGCLYWIARKLDDVGRWICGVILCFDLERETLKEETSFCGQGIFYEDYESSLNGDGKFRNLLDGVLGLLQNSLCLALYRNRMYSDLFVMEENQVTKVKHWIKLISVRKTGPGAELYTFNTLHPICVTRNGDVLTNEYATAGLFLIDQHGWVKKIAIHGLRLPSAKFHVIPYVESLVSPTA